jgi:hypothetical protein
MVLIGVAALSMAFILIWADPIDFDPDPDLQALIWVAFGISCFAVAWSRRNWRPPPDR